MRQFDCDLNARQEAQLKFRLDERAADAQIGDPAGSHREGMPGYSHRDVHPNSLAPSVFH
jgi:hypothetical protein